MLAVLLLPLALALLTMAAVRMVLLPQVDRFREPIAAAVGSAIGQPVALGRVTAGWSGWRPWVTVRDLRVLDERGSPALRLGQATAVLGWNSLSSRELAFHTLSLEGLDLQVRRDRAGLLRVGGVRTPLDGEDGRFADWLRSQERIALTSARVTWVDELRGAPPLRLEDVSFDAHRVGAGHGFRLRARPAAEVGEPLELEGELREQPGTRYGGRLHLRAGRLDLGAARRWVDLPVRFESGSGALEAWAQVGGGALQEATLDLRLTDVVLSLADDDPSLAMPGLQGRLVWRALPDGFELSARRLSLQLGDGSALPAADATLRRRHGGAGAPPRLELRAQRLDLAPLAYVLERLPMAPELREALAAHHPRGEFTDLSLWVERRVTGPLRFGLDTRLAGVALSAVDPWPGVRGLSGRLTAGPEGARLELGGGAVLLLPDVAEPVALDGGEAAVAWTTGPEGLRLELRAARLEGPDLAATASGSLAWQPDGTPRLDLKAVASRVSLPALRTLLPGPHLADARAFAREAFRAGTLSGATLLVQGDPRHLPFDRGEGRLEVAGTLTGGTLALPSGWPQAEQLAGTLQLRGRRLEAVVSGTVAGNRVPRADVLATDLGRPAAQVRVSLEAPATAAGLLRLARVSPFAGTVRDLGESLEVAGAVGLRLAVVVPPARPETSRVEGVLTLGGNRITGLAGLPPLDAVRGALQFGSAGLRLADGSAEVLGRPVRFSVGAGPGGGLRAEARGRVPVAALTGGRESPLLALLRGESDWRVVAQLHEGGVELEASSDLRGLAVDLPVPLGKAAGDAQPARVRVRLGPEVISASAVVGGEGRLEAAAVLARRPAGLELRRAAVAVGGPARLPAAPGVSLDVRAGRIALDDWLTLWRRLPPGGAEGATAPPGLPLGVSLVADRLVSSGRELREVKVAARRRADGWEGEAQGPDLAGRFTWRGAGRGNLEARLERLHVPEISPAVPAPQSGTIAGEDLPELDLEAASFRFGVLDFGTLTLQAGPVDASWKLRRLEMQAADGRITAEGGWLGGRGRSRTAVAVRVDARDAGSMLNRLGKPGTLNGGTARVAGTLEWDGPPTRLDLASLTGRLSLEARGGRFSRMDPGIGKLLSILSLQALPRRIALDFRDVFSPGFAFDELTASTTIHQGVMRTTDLRMTGTSASVAMMGEVDLARETQDLEVRVVPALSDSVALGTAAVVNPAAGLAAYLLGKVFGNPLGKAASFQFRVSGPWAEPVVTSSRLAGGAGRRP